MNTSASGTATLNNEPSSAFDSDRDVKDRKLAQILQKLRMEQDLESLKRSNDGNRRSQEAISEQSEELNMEKRPRKILDYALLAKGRSSRNSLVGSFETDDADKNSSTDGKRIRFRKRQFDEYSPPTNPRRRSEIGQQLGSAGKKSATRSKRSSFPPTVRHGGVKKRATRSRSFTHGMKAGGVLKRNLKYAANVKQAFLISKAALVDQSQNFEEFYLPQEWIKQAKKQRKNEEEENKKKITRRKSESADGNSTGDGAVSSSRSIREIAMKRLISGFKAARLLYPEKFAKCFPDLMHCFEDEQEETKVKKRRRRRNGVLSKEGEEAVKRLKAVMPDRSDTRKTDTSGNNSSSDEASESTPKRTRKMPKGFEDFAIGSEMGKKKRIPAAVQKEQKLPDVKEKLPDVDTRKISRISDDTSSAGISGLRKRLHISTDTTLITKPKNVLDENTEDARKITDSAKMSSKTSANKKRMCSRLGNTKKVPGARGRKAAALRNSMEDSEGESSSDESDSSNNNVRTSKRQRVQSGFYKTMVTQYDKKRSRTHT